METRPARVGVMIPAYNAENFITETISSIFEQTYTDWHLYISDDASTDNTADVIRDYIKDRDNVTFMQQSENIGNPKNRNALLASAQHHEYLAILDSDDIAAPTRLAKQVEFLNQHPDISLIGSNVTIIDENGDAQGTRVYPETHTEIKSALLVFDPFAQPAVMFRSSILETVGGYDEDLARCQDYDLFIRMIRGGYKAHNVQESLIRFRVFNGQGKYQNLSRAFFYSFKVRNRHLFSRDCFSVRGFFMWFMYLGGFISSKILPQKLFAIIFHILFIRNKS